LHKNNAKISPESKHRARLLSGLSYGQSRTPARTVFIRDVGDNALKNPMRQIKKEVNNTIKVLEDFFDERFYTAKFDHISVDDALVKTIKTDQGFYFESNKMVLTSHKDTRKLFDRDDEDIILRNFSQSIIFNIRGCSEVNFSVKSTGPSTLSGIIKEFKTDKFSDYKEGYFRATLITNKNFNLASYLGTNIDLEINKVAYGSGVIEFKVKGVEFQIFSYEKEKGNKFYFIENANKLTYEDFVNVLDEIILGVTYLTGEFLGSEIYILGSHNSSFIDSSVISLKRFFDELKDGYMAVPFSIFQSQCELPIKVFGEISFGNLITKMCESLIYKRAILLICQAHTEPSYVQSALYSVSLETITNEISPLIESKVNPIKSKSLAKMLRKDLLQVLETYEDELTANAKRKIEGDISRINSPTNKQKLNAPFDYYDIKLSEKDIDAIARRNDFLHGRIPEEYDYHELRLINARLLFCINALILKSIQYSGYIMYHPSMYQLNNKVEADELPIRSI